MVGAHRVEEQQRDERTDGPVHVAGVGGRRRRVRSQLFGDPRRRARAVGAPEHDHPSPQVFNLIFKRRRLAGSLIGGIAETQEMLDFCAQHGITSDIEVIPMQQINAAYERMLKSDVKYRFVVDMASLAQ